MTKPTAGWTMETLLTYVERILSDHEARDLERHTADRDSVAVQFRGSAQAIEKAEAADQRRFELLNEFRGQLSDQAATFMPRAEFDRAHVALSSRMDTQTDANAQRIGRLEARVTEQGGRSVAYNQGWTVLVSLVLAAAAIGAIVFYATH